MILKIKATAFFSPLLILLYNCSVVLAGVALCPSRPMMREMTTQDFITWLHSPPIQVGAKSICFYSGRSTIEGVPTSVYEYIQDFASKRGCQTMQDLIKQSGIDQTGWRTEPEWMETSVALGEVASKNPTYSLLGTTVLKDSIWIRGELPALLKNPKVKTIQVWELTNTGTYVKERDNIKP